MGNAGEQLTEPRRTFGQITKQAGLFVLFATILVIPRIRRLRRRVWVWSGVRLGVAVCATWLGWRYTHAGAGVATLVLALLLFAFSLLLRAKPEETSVDALARELNALIVLNGGAFRLSPDSIPLEQAQIFVLPDQIIVLGPRERRLVEIPFAQVQNLTVRPASGENPGAWEVEIDWMSEAPCTTRFQYDGGFAEHLARVTELTLRNQWKKELPVIQ